MSRYYFDIHDANGVTEDDEGLELSNIDQVQDEAARSLADMARDEVRRGGDNLVRMAIHARDDAGLVMQVRFSFEIDRKH